MSDGAQPLNHRTLGATAAATTTVDFSTGSVLYLQLTQAANTIALRSMRRGATYKLIVQQDAVGGRTIAGFTYNGAAVTPVAGASVGQLDLGANNYTLYEFVGLNSTIAPGVAVAISAVTGALGAITGDDVNITATDDVNITAGDDIAINAVGATGRVSINGADLVSLGVSATNGSASIVTTGADATITLNASGATSDVAIAATDDVTITPGDALAVTCGGNASIACTAGSVSIAAGGAGNDVTLTAPDDVNLTPTDRCNITAAGLVETIGAGGIATTSSGSFNITSTGGGGIVQAQGGSLQLIGLGGTIVRSGVGGTLTLDVNAVNRMRADATGLAFFDSAPAAQPAAIPDAGAGTEIATINSILAALRTLGIIDT